MTPLSYDKALNKAANLCSKSEKSPKEIYDKLASWGLKSQMAEQIVCRLRDEKYIDEERFARAFVHDKFLYEHWGRVKIAYNLRNKGIANHIIDNALDDVIADDDYLSTLSSLLRNKMRDMERPLSQNNRAKLYRFAAQRGFESGVVSIALRKVGINGEENLED